MIAELLQPLPPETVLALIGLGVVALVILTLRFGRRLAILLVLLIGLGAVLALALALAGQSAANVQTARVAAEATAQAAQAQRTGSLAVTVLSLLLVVLLVVAALAVGYLYLRWRVAEYRLGASQGHGALRLPPARRRRLSHQARSLPVVYVVEPESDVEDDGDALEILRNVDPSLWGW